MLGLTTLKRWIGRKPRETRGGDGTPPEGWVKGRLDAARTPEEERDYWANADGLSANATLSPDVRAAIRNKARYEIQNNPIANGLIESIGNDAVGTGPRIQLSLPENFRGAPVSTDSAALVELLFAKWCRKIDLAEKLRIMVKAEEGDGETFGVKTSNPEVRKSEGVALDLRLYECDQVTTPDLSPNDPHATDGIRYDQHGNPVEYHFLKAHPGGTAYMPVMEYDRIPASSVIHFFAPSRAGQGRGVSRMNTALRLFGQLRRYTNAVITAAETGASIAGVMTTKHGTYQTTDGAATAPAQMQRIQFGHATLLTLPPETDAKGFDNKQPQQEYGGFKGAISEDIGRPFQTPFNVTSGNSSAYNFSSAKLDMNRYRKFLGVFRSRIAAKILDNLFREWLDEASDAGLLPDGLPPFALWTWEWHWDGFESIDPLKDAQADEINLRIGATTLAEIYSARGKDWEKSRRQRAKEIALDNELGISAFNATAPVASYSTPQQDENGNDIGSPSTASQAAASGGVQATALNGAQIASLLMICDKVAAKQYPPAAAEAMIQAAFPLMSKSLIKTFIGSLGSVKAPTPAAPAADGQQVPQGDFANAV